MRCPHATDKLCCAILRKQNTKETVQIAHPMPRPRNFTTANVVNCSSQYICSCSSCHRLSTRLGIWCQLYQQNSPGLKRIAKPVCIAPLDVWSTAEVNKQADACYYCKQAVERPFFLTLQRCRIRASSEKTKSQKGSFAATKEFQSLPANHRQHTERNSL